MAEVHGNRMHAPFCNKSLLLTEFSAKNSWGKFGGNRQSGILSQKFLSLYFLFILLDAVFISPHQI